MTTMKTDGKSLPKRVDEFINNVLDFMEHSNGSEIDRQGFENVWTLMGIVSFFKDKPDNMTPEEEQTMDSIIATGSRLGSKLLHSIMVRSAVENHFKKGG